MATQPELTPAERLTRLENKADRFEAILESLVSFLTEPDPDSGVTMRAFDRQDILARARARRPGGTP